MVLISNSWQYVDFLFLWLFFCYIFKVRAVSLTSLAAVCELSFASLFTKLLAFHSLWSFLRVTCHSVWGFLNFNCRNMWGLVHFTWHSVWGFRHFTSNSVLGFLHFTFRSVWIFLSLHVLFFPHLLQGCKVIAFAGSDAKVDYVKSLGADFVFNYKTQDVDAALKKAAPDGVNIYFDNVRNKDNKIP